MHPLRSRMQTPSLSSYGLAKYRLAHQTSPLPDSVPGKGHQYGLTPHDLAHLSL